MKDALGRNIDYMRVSITDRCNLRCQYCMPGGMLGGMPGEFVPLSHNDILRYEEILRVCAIAAQIGIRTIKVTGGEPLARKGCVGFMEKLKALPDIDHVTLTTNGALLEPYVEALAEMGLDGLNISLDALDPEVYLKVTGRDLFDATWRSLHKAIGAGLRVKVNCVPIRDTNDAEIVPIARLAETLPVDVRFIELMPTAAGACLQAEACLQGIPSAEIFALLLEKYPDLTSDPSVHGFGPARYFSSKRLKGGIGLISAVSHHFCSDCNRLRLTSDGFLKLCLYRNDGLDVRGMLRGGASDDELLAAIKRTVHEKPAGQSINNQTGNDHQPDSEGIGFMSRIGG